LTDLSELLAFVQVCSHQLLHGAALRWPRQEHLTLVGSFW